MIPKDDILANALRHYVYLHQHPEVSFEEYSTSAYIRKVLEGLGIPYEIAGKTGTIALLPGKDSSRTIALRADIDALPLKEDILHPVVSHAEGVMHACGHDLHTACLLGAAEQLKTGQSLLPTNIMLIFQHAEEILPGGAQDIIGHPFFQTHLPEWIFAQHAEPELPVGTIGIHPGQYMASGDEIYITLRGPGGHAAFPDKTADLILIASHIIVALQQISSRKASPFIPTVLTFGNIRCESVMNIIPREIRLEGTFRTFDEQWRQEGKKHIREIARSIAESMGASTDIDIIEGYPSLYNHPVKTQQIACSLKNILGEERVISLPQRMTTEDFARYSQLIPATFIRLGVKGKQGSCGKLHTAEFFPDTNAIQYGIQILCSIVNF